MFKNERTFVIMKYAIIGTGGIGGYYGGKLAKAGNEVHFLLHSDYDFVRENGIQVDSHLGSFHIDNPNIYRKVEEMPKCDAVIVGLKTTNNHLLKYLLPHVIKEDTVVLLIQNGIGVESDVQKMVPTAHLVAGLGFICTAKIGPGHIDHQFFGKITMANYSCPNTLQFGRLVDEFRMAGVETFEVEYQLARWRKAVWNMPFNGMSVALNVKTNVLVEEERNRDLIRRQMLEVVGAANALGVSGLTEEFADNMIAETLTMPPYSPSMKLDYDNHRPMEIYYLYTRPIQMASEMGFDMPLLKHLEQTLLQK